MKMRYSLHSEDQRLVFLFFVAWVSILLLSSMFFLYGPPFVPLWYSFNVITEQLAPKVFIWSLPGLATVILILSLFFGRRTDLEHERYLARISLWTGLVLLVFLLISLIRILKITL